MDLRDKVIVVTGASSGIGVGIARELAGAGAKLVLTARRLDRLEALAKELPTESALLAAEIDQAETPQRLLDLAKERFGRVDGIINNAGMFTSGTIDSVDLEEISRMIRVNFEAVVRASYVFARELKRNGGGAIINVSSIGAYLTMPMGGVYSGLKHALEAFTASLRIELKGTGVKVGTVAPGTTQSEIFDKVRAQGMTVRADQIPPLDPIDIGVAVRFMLEQRDRVNIARLAIFSSDEIA